MENEPKFQTQKWEYEDDTWRGQKVSQYVIGVDIDEFFTLPQWVVHTLFFQGLSNTLALDSYYSLLRRTWEVDEPRNIFRKWSRCHATAVAGLTKIFLLIKVLAVDLAYDNMSLNDERERTLLRQVEMREV